MSLPGSYQDNLPSPAPNTDVGLKISKPGYDAGHTSGGNYIFNSSWPSLPIAFETTVPNTITSSSATLTIPHKLGFPPFTVCYIYGYDANSGITVARRYFPSVDSTNITLSGGSIDGFNQNFVFSATKINFKCFQLDLSQDIDYKLAPGDTFKIPYDNSYGLKAVLPGKNINSTDLRDFAIHSRAQSSLILAVKTSKTSNPANTNIVQYTNHYNYPVWFYGYGVSSGTYANATYYAQGGNRTFTDGFVGYVQGTSPSLCLVVMRDPMYAATQLTVQY